MRKAASGFNHVAGPYVDGLQLCTVCEGTICDDRGTQYATVTDRPRGFADGPVHRLGPMTATGRDPELEDCIPIS